MIEKIATIKKLAVQMITAPDTATRVATYEELLELLEGHAADIDNAIAGCEGARDAFVDMMGEEDWKDQLDNLSALESEK